MNRHIFHNMSAKLAEFGITGIYFDDDEGAGNGSQLGVLTSTTTVSLLHYYIDEDFVVMGTTTSFIYVYNKGTDTGYFFGSGSGDNTGDNFPGNSLSNISTHADNVGNATGCLRIGNVFYFFLNNATNRVWTINMDTLVAELYTNAAGIGTGSQLDWTNVSTLGVIHDSSNDRFFIFPGIPGSTSAVGLSMYLWDYGADDCVKYSSGGGVSAGDNLSLTGNFKGIAYNVTNDKLFILSSGSAGGGTLWELTVTSNTGLLYLFEDTLGDEGGVNGVDYESLGNFGTFGLLDAYGDFLVMKSGNGIGRYRISNDTLKFYTTSGGTSAGDNIPSLTYAKAANFGAELVIYQNSSSVSNFIWIVNLDTEVGKNYNDSSGVISGDNLIAHEASYTNQFAIFDSTQIVIIHSGSSGANHKVWKLNRATGAGKIYTLSGLLPDNFAATVSINFYVSDRFVLLSGSTNANWYGYYIVDLQDEKGYLVNTASMYLTPALSTNWIAFTVGISLLPTLKNKYPATGRTGVFKNGDNTYSAVIPGKLGATATESAQNYFYLIEL